MSYIKIKMDTYWLSSGFAFPKYGIYRPKAFSSMPLNSSKSPNISANTVPFALFTKLELTNSASDLLRCDINNILHLKYTLPNCDGLYYIRQTRS